MPNNLPNYTLDKHLVTSVIGHIYFLVLLIFSLIFYQERMLYYDPAFFSFEMLNNKDFSIALGRWGSYLSQILPMWAIREGLSLEKVLQLFSISFILIYYGIFLIIHYLLKDIEASMVQLLSLCLCFRLAFYYPTAELYQGIAISVFYWSILRKVVNLEGLALKMGILLLITICVILSYFHQLTFFLVIFFVGLEWINNNYQKTKLFLIITVLTSFWYLIRIKFLTYSDYENKKMLSIKEFVSNLPSITNSDVYVYFTKFINNELLLILIIFSAAIIFVARKKPILAAYIVASLLVYAIIILNTLHKGESFIMMENYFALFGVFIAVPIVLLIVPFNKYIYISIVTILIGYSFNRIYVASIPLSNRVQHLGNIIDYGKQFKEKKYIIKEDNYKDDFLWSTWSFPFETLLHSSINGPSGVSFYIIKENQILNSKEISQKGVFLGPDWDPFTYQTFNLNKNYFRIPSGEYLMLSTSQDKMEVNDTVINNSNFKITPVKNEYYNNELIELELLNESEIMLPSLPGNTIKILLSYHLLDVNYNIIAWDNPRTTIELDLYPGKQLVQFVKVVPPEQPGEYIIKFDMVTETKRWWNLESQIKLIVNNKL